MTRTRELHASPHLNSKMSFQQNEKLTKLKAKPKPLENPDLVERAKIQQACIAALHAISLRPENRVTPSRPGVEAMYKQLQLFDAFKAQERALEAFADNRATPAQEILAKAAITDYCTPDQCKATHAMKLHKTLSDGTRIFTTPSKSNAPDWNYTTVSPSGRATCGCHAKGHHWHLDAVQKLHALYKKCEPVSVELADRTQAAMDRDKAQWPINYVNYFED